MLLRADAGSACEQQFRLVEDMHLNTIRLEGKLETEDFFRLADEQGILVMLGWCCCDHWEHWKKWTPKTSPSPPPRCARRCCACATTPACWSGSTAATIRRRPTSRALISTSKPRRTGPTRSSPPPPQQPTTVTGDSGVKMTGPYDYVAPCYWLRRHR